MFKKQINKIFGSMYDDILNESECFDNMMINQATTPRNNNDNNQLPYNNVERTNTNNDVEDSNLLPIVDELNIRYSQGYNTTISTNEPFYSNYHQKLYKDFDTIDWMDGNIANKIDSINVKSKLQQEKGFSNKIRYLFEMINGWLIMIALGFIGGIIVPLILVGGEWLTDIRQGYCSTEFTNNFFDCCRLTSVSYSYSNQCADWVTWGETIGITNKTFNFIFNYMVYVLISMIFAGMAASIVKLIAPYACGTGITEIQTILSGFVIKGFLGVRTSFVKFIVAILTLGSGLNVSHEGVLIHFCSSMANWLSRPIRKFNSNAAKLREVIGAGACAGFSLAFAAPISGLLFGLETMCYYFPNKTVWRTFSCVLISTFVFMQFKHWIDSDEVMLAVKSSGIWHFRELLLFSIIGILGGLGGALFKFLLTKWSLTRKNTIVGNYPITEVILLSFITSMISYPIPIFRGGNYSTLRYIFSVCQPFNINSICNYRNKIILDDTSAGAYNQPIYPNDELRSMIWKLPLFASIKLLLTTVTTSSKIPSGFFLPIIVTGACIGRSIGISMEYLNMKYENSNFFKQMCFDLNKRCISPEVYAIIGASAFLSGVTHLTITLVVLIIELTNKDHYIVPMMLCVTLAKLISEKLIKSSIFQCQSEINSYPYMDRILEKSMRNCIHTSITSLLFIQKHSNHKYVVLYENSMTLSDVFHVLENDFHGYPLLDNCADMKLLGYVKRLELINLINSLDVMHEQNTDETIITKPICFIHNNIDQYNCDQYINLSACIDYNIIQLCIRTNIDVVAEYFQLLGVRTIFVISQGKFVGIITKKDFLISLA